VRGIAGSRRKSISDTFLITKIMAQFQIGVDVCISGLTIMHWYNYNEHEEELHKLPSLEEFVGS